MREPPPCISPHRGRPRLLVLPSAVLAVFLGSGAARADAAPAPEAAVQPTLTSDENASPKRALPAYGGRAPAPTSVGDVLVWIPRALLFPAYVVTDFVVRRPLGALTRVIEGLPTPDTAASEFSFGTGKRSGLVPTAHFDTDFRPSAGVYFFYDRFVISDNGLRVQAAFGGTDWLHLTVGDRLALSPRSSVELRVDTAHRSDFTFNGTGARSLAADRGRYGSDYVEGSLSFTTTLPRGFEAKTRADLATVQFRDVTCCHEPSVVVLAQAGRYALPASFDAGYTALRAGGELTYDSRPMGAGYKSGVRLRGNATYGSDLRAPGASGWIRYGGSARGFLDLFGHGRVLSLQGTVLFADPLGDRDVPFTELVPLGGSGPMSGFHEGRLLGRSAAALALEYRYPIWAFLDTSLQLSVGNVFDAHLADFSAQDLRLAFAVGVQTVGVSTQSLSLLFGGGTETFAQGGHLGELRLALGLKQGF